MEETRPYWKVIISLLFSLTATGLCVVVGLELLWFFMPFVIGWLIACIANPLVCFLEKHLKIVKKFGSAIIIITVLAALVGTVYLGIHKLSEEIVGFLSNFPEMYKEMEAGFREIGESMEGLIRLLPENVRTACSEFLDNATSILGSWVGKLGEPTVEAAGNVAKKIPSVLVATIVTIVSAYFFIAEHEEVISWFGKITPKPIKRRVAMVVANLKSAVGGYFKAQFKIMLVVVLLLFIGFWIIGVNYAILLAVLIAMLDFLPVFGTGTALIPWSVYKLLVGDYKMAIMLIVLYGITQLVRQVIQPKLVGDSVGLKPLPTLAFLYIGYKIGSIFGMIFAVPVGMIVINMYEAGAFDYILDDVKILVKGILSLRE